MNDISEKIEETLFHGLLLCYNSSIIGLPSTQHQNDFNKFYFTYNIFYLLKCFILFFFVQCHFAAANEDKTMSETSTTTGTSTEKKSHKLKII